MKPLNKRSIDEALNHQQSQGVHQWVKSIDDEPVAMVWRADLNQKLIVAAQKKHRKRIFKLSLAWGGSFASGVACLAVFSLLNAPKPQTLVNSGSSDLQQQMIKAHQESAIFATVSGTGVMARETDMTYVDPYEDNLY